MKKLFMVLTLLIMGMVGLSQTQASENDATVMSYESGENLTLEDYNTLIDAVDNDGRLYFLYNSSDIINADLYDPFIHQTSSHIYITENDSLITGEFGKYISIQKSDYSFEVGENGSFISNLQGSIIIYPNVSITRLEITDITSGDTMTQEQDDILTQMLQASEDVTLTYDGNDYILSDRPESGETHDGIVEDVTDPNGVGIAYISGDLMGMHNQAPIAGIFSLSMTIDLGDISNPLIYGTNSHVTDFDNPMTLADIQDELIAVDDVDGNLTSSITVYEDNYTGNENVLGVHTISFAVEDAVGNSSQFVVNIEIEDTTPPVLTLVGNETVYIDAGQTYIDEGVTITDNADNNPFWAIDGGDHGVETSIPGTYLITYRGEDEDQNEATPITRTVIVEDNSAPYVEGMLIVIETTDQINASLNDLLSNIIVIDDHDDAFDGSYTIASDDYTTNMNVAGNYLVELRAEDQYGNVMNYGITIQVSEAVPYDADYIPVDFLGENVFSYLVTSDDSTETQWVYIELVDIPEEERFKISIHLSNMHSENETIKGLAHAYFVTYDSLGNEIGGWMQSFDINITDLDLLKGETNHFYREYAPLVYDPGQTYTVEFEGATFTMLDDSVMYSRYDYDPFDIGTFTMPEEESTGDSGNDDDDDNPGGIISPSEDSSLQLFGIDWFYWVIVAIILVYFVLGTKKGRKAVGLE